MVHSPATRTEVRPGPHGPLVVRVALDERGRAVLAREADRLRRARHPGVVEIATTSDDEIELVWAGAETLATATPTVPEAAAILAAVAATVADLHRLRIVHGRLDPSHVVLGPDGRPRLCGLRGQAPDERPPGPADDVAALGGLLDHLIGEGAEIEPIPDRRWRRHRWSGYQRRALQMLADGATDPDPARRPTAAALARAIAEAVPDAELPTPTPAPGATAAGPATATGPAPTDDDPADDRDRTTDGGDGDGEPSGAIPASNELPPPRPPTSAPAPPPPPPAPVASPATTPERADAPRAGATRPAARSAASSGAGRPRPATTAGTSPGHDDPTNPSPPSARPGRARRRATRSDRRAAALLVAAALVGLAVLAGRDLVPGGGPATSPAEPVAAPATTAPAAMPPTACTEPGHLDLDGDGCPDPHRVEQTTVRALGRTYEVGRPGDRVQVADWDCDGIATIAVVRPGTGEIFLFDGWSLEGGAITVAAVDVVQGARSLRAGTGPSCVPVAEGPDGLAAPLDLRREGS